MGGGLGGAYQPYEGFGVVPKWVSWGGGGTQMCPSGGGGCNFKGGHMAFSG